MGNADYSFGPLRSPVNDAEAMAKALGEAGFDVTVATDADQASMERRSMLSGPKLKARGGVGVFYFSGHGAQINGENYLIPVSLTSAEEIKRGSRIDSNASLFVSYATSPGAVALDGTGHNSPYTKYLSEWIATPNLSIEDTFKRTLKGALDLLDLLRSRGHGGRRGG